MTQQDLTQILENVRVKHDLPAMAVAVAQSGQIKAAATGFRKDGDKTRVTTNDKFHIGSCTKAMTATMIAMEVEKGKLDWNTTLAKALPNMESDMKAEYREVTIRHLLTHRAGLPPPERSYPEGTNWYTLTGSPREQRRQYLHAVLNLRPEYQPGTEYKYSNAGYVVLGAILEQAYRKDWEMLAREMLFEPLGMETAGFGAMASPGRVDQPWQHVVRAGKKTAIGGGVNGDNAVVLGPAGRVHCSVKDWAKFADMHLRGASGKGGLLKPETIKLMHTPGAGEEYAMGWVVTERSWGGGRVLTHAGSNTMSFAVIWLAPLKNFGVMVTTNQGGDTGAKAIDEAAGAVISKLL